MKRLSIFNALLGILILAGCWAVFQRMSDGLAATNLSSQVAWGTWVAFYIYFVGLSAGSFLLSTIIYVFGQEKYERIGRDALLAAILSMVLAMCFILLDLGRVERFWHTLYYMNITSVLAWEVRFYGLYIALLSAELWFAMRIDLIRLSSGGEVRNRIARFLTFGSTDTSPASVARDHRWLKVMGAIGIPVATLGVHGGTGSLFAVVKAMPYWHSGLFPVVFIVSALVSGTALLMLVYAIRRAATGRQPDWKLMEGLAGLVLLFLAIDAGLQFYEFLIAGYGMKEHEWATLEVMLAGGMRWVFWGVQVFIGIVLPVFILTQKRWKRSLTAGMIASGSVVIGILGVRFNIVLPPYLVPKMEGLPAGVYTPSAVEIVSSIGIVAFGLVLYQALNRLLPIEPLDEENPASAPISPISAHQYHAAQERSL